MINIQEILLKGVRLNASDVHLVYRMKPIVRINRDLVELDNYDVLSSTDLIDIFEFFTNGNQETMKSFNKKKKMDLNYHLENTSFRINVSMSGGIFLFTIRIINDKLPEFSSLGLPDIVRRLARQPQGLILITGKSNSGKSTTLNALVSEINRTENKKIMMLEDPIEYKHTSNKSLIIQKEIGEGRDCNSFSEGAINSLREDCDILIVGEVRDRETMDAILELSESGYLVFGTMHTRSCSETIDRILNFYDLNDQRTIKYMMSSVLKAVVSQRLLKGVNSDLVMCPEIMIVDDIIAGHLRKDKISKTEIEDAMLAGLSKGSITLIFALANLVANGKITMEMAQSQIEEKEYEHLSNTVYRMKNRLINGWKY